MELNSLKKRLWAPREDRTMRKRLLLNCAVSLLAYALAPIPALAQQGSIFTFTWGIYTPYDARHFTCVNNPYEFYAAIYAYGEKVKLMKPGETICDKDTRVFQVAYSAIPVIAVGYANIDGRLGEHVGMANTVLYLQGGGIGSTNDWVIPGFQAANGQLAREFATKVPAKILTKTTKVRFPKEYNDQNAIQIGNNSEDLNFLIRANGELRGKINPGGVFCDFVVSYSMYAAYRVAAVDQAGNIIGTWQIPVGGSSNGTNAQQFILNRRDFR